MGRVKRRSKMCKNANMGRKMGTMRMAASWNMVCTTVWKSSSSPEAKAMTKTETRSISNADAITNQMTKRCVRFAFLMLRYGMWIQRGGLGISGLRSSA